MTRRAIVFDLDGTLVDAFRDITEAVNRPFASRGMPTHSLEKIRSMVGDGAGKLLERASPPGIAPEVFAAVKAEMMAWYHDHPADYAFVYEGIVDVLKELRAEGYRIGVLSNKPHPMTVKTCEILGLAPLIDDMAGENFPTVPRKPHPQGLREQLARLGATEAVLVGDGIPDAEVSAAAGIPFIAVTWGTRTREQLAVHNPVALIDHAAELPRAIRAVFHQSA